jgi:hypothetical protein
MKFCFFLLQIKPHFSTGNVFFDLDVDVDVDDDLFQMIFCIKVSKPLKLALPLKTYSHPLPLKILIVNIVDKLSN